MSVSKNASGLRNLFGVTPRKFALLKEAMEEAGIREADLEEKYFSASTRGGQRANKAETGVILRHRPTGTLVRCRKTRSRALNRYYARKILAQRLRERR
ncbi:MAG: peptide chain release factor-like protein [Candidatus Hydrogenedentota bacterium]|nr:MAG: peptide chain release factor-like protein [Candidatus Hydrogenedentota bacterium]